MWLHLSQFQLGFDTAIFSKAIEVHEHGPLNALKSVKRKVDSFFWISVIQLQARLGQPRKVICTLLGHIQKA